jgi:hypothetical protein
MRAPRMRVARSGSGRAAESYARRSCKAALAQGRAAASMCAPIMGIATSGRSRPADPWVDEAQSLLEVLEEVSRPKNEHVDTGYATEALLLSVETRNRPRARGEVGADAAEKDDAADAVSRRRPSLPPPSCSAR